MRHDRQRKRPQVAVVSADLRRSGVGIGDWDRDCHDHQGFVPASGGNSRSIMHREAHSQSTSPRPPGPLGRETVIACLRFADLLFLFLILFLPVITWVL